ncbi:MAG: hypothetical protein ACXVNO_02670 [Bacteroidia bacterium]
MSKNAYDRIVTQNAPYASTELINARFGTEIKIIKPVTGVEQFILPLDNLKEPYYEFG